MSHFAKIDENNKVIQVIVAEQDFINSGSVGDPKNWIQCSYNSNFRAIYPSVGDIYNPTLDIFELGRTNSL